MKTTVLFLAMLLAGSPVGALPQNQASKQYSLQVGHVVNLSWTASTTPGVTYNVYVGTTSGGPYTRINSSPVTGLTYSDLNVIAGNTYYYVATAVDSTGAESAYSNEVKAIIPVP